MPRLATFREAEAPHGLVELDGELPDGAAPGERHWMVAPGGDNCRRLVHGRGNHLVVRRTDGIPRGAQQPGLRRPPRKEVDDVDAAEPPGFREAHAPADRRVERLLVGGARIEHDPEHARPRRLPLTPEAITIAPPRIERRAAPHDAFSV